MRYALSISSGFHRPVVSPMATSSSLSIALFLVTNLTRSLFDERVPISHRIDKRLLSTESRRTGPSVIGEHTEKTKETRQETRRQVGAPVQSILASASSVRRSASAWSRRCGNDPCAVMSYNWSMTVATPPPGSSVGVRELKNQLSSFLDRVKAGEEITVTEHGRPIARLSAVGSDVDRMAVLVAAGIVQPATGRQRRLPSKRVKLSGGASALAGIVAEQRG